jgi:hypothetical protein
MIYTFVTNNEKIFPIEKTYQVLQVGRRTYYHWKSHYVPEIRQRIAATKEKLTSIYFKSKQYYYPKVRN